jgi:hypothetical protein
VCDTGLVAVQRDIRLTGDTTYPAQIRGMHEAVRVAASSSLSNGAKLQKCSLCGGIDTSNLLTRGQAFAWQRPGRHPDAHHGGVGDGLNEREL